jgi:hypothetical protein
MNQVLYLVLNVAFYAIGAMIEINIFSVIMGLSLIGLIPLAIWASKPDFQAIRRILKE